MRFNEEQLEMYELIAADGETMELRGSVFPSDHDGAIEEWMLEMRNKMRISVRLSMHEGLLAYPTTDDDDDYEKWVKEW